VVRPPLTVAIAVVLAVLLGASCTSTEPSAVVVEEPVAAGPVSGDRVLADLEPSIALVETPAGSGSAILLEDGRLLTNAHVVDPYSVVQVSFGGQDPVEATVAGVDFTADVAVIDLADAATPGAARGVRLADPADLAAGSALYLVGYPGDPTDPEITITSGVLSRRRQLEEWDLDLLQTDALISGGQSGGALVDDRGRVIGMSGFEYDEEFGLAVAGPDVLEAADGIETGGGSDWVPVPDESEATLTSDLFRVAEAGWQGIAWFPASDEERSLEVTTEIDASYVLFAPDLTVLAADPGGEDVWWYEEELEVTPEVAAGRWVTTIPAGEEAFLLLEPADEAIGSIEVTSSVPFANLTPSLPVERVEVGEEVEGTVNLLFDAVYHRVDLAEGQTVYLVASSSFGDVAVSIWSDEVGDDQVDLDDGGGGLWDLDAAGSFTAGWTGSTGSWSARSTGTRRTTGSRSIRADPVTPPGGRARRGRPDGASVSLRRRWQST
jgi:hypothetical protein